MNEYIGKTCPYCKTKFVENDDVVICSNCEMPHHKECWIENQGCTTFGCTGTIRAVDGAPNTVTTNQMNYEQPRRIFCASCGAPNTTAATFCPRCGNRLVKPL